MAGNLRSRALILVLMTAGISGISTFVNFWAVQGANSDAFIAVRNSVVAVLLLPFALLAHRAFRRRLRRVDWIRLALIGLVGGAIPFLLFFRGLQLASAAGSAGAATASFGYRILFVIAAVFAVVFLRERLSRRLLAAASLLLAGNVLLLSLFEPLWTDGMVLVLAATTLWAGEYTMSKRALQDLPSGVVALGRMGFGGIFLVAYLAGSGQVGAVTSLAADRIAWLVLSAILLVGFVSTWYAGLKHTDLTVATSMLVLGFPISLVLSALVGRTALDLGQAVGIAAIGVGICLAIGAASLRDSWAYLLEAVRLRTGRGA